MERKREAERERETRKEGEIRKLSLLASHSTGKKDVLVMLPLITSYNVEAGGEMSVTHRGKEAPLLLLMHFELVACLGICFWATDDDTQKLTAHCAWGSAGIRQCRGLNLHASRCMCI